MKTTLNKIRAHSPCSSGWQKLLRYLGKTQADDEPLSILTILDSNGLGDALWCLRAVEGHDREIRLYAIWCARQVQHLMTDPRSLAALDVAERYARGEATNDELADAAGAAADAAWDAADVATDAATDAALAAARAAADATCAAADATCAAADEAWDAAMAARAAAAGAAGAEAWDAADAADAARAAARTAQAARLREVCADGRGVSPGS